MVVVFASARYVWMLLLLIWYGSAPAFYFKKKLRKIGGKHRSDTDWWMNARAVFSTSRWDDGWAALDPAYNVKAFLVVAFASKNKSSTKEVKSKMCFWLKSVFTILLLLIGGSFEVFTWSHLGSYVDTLKNREIL